MYSSRNGGQEAIVERVRKITRIFHKNFSSKKLSLLVVSTLAILGGTLLLSNHPVFAANEDQATWVSANRLTYLGDPFTGPTLITPDNYYRYTSTTAVECKDDNGQIVRRYDFIEFQRDPTKQGNSNQKGFLDRWNHEAQESPCEKTQKNKAITMLNQSNVTQTQAQGECAGRAYNEQDACVQAAAERICATSDRADRASCVTNQTTAVPPTGVQVLGSTTDPDAADPNAAPEEDICNFDGNPMTWFICPILDSAVAAIGAVDGFITSSLTFGTDGIFENDSGFYAAWNSFRIIATALLVLAGLAIVISQALGFEFLDAYTLRKSLPRLLVAVVGISLSWYLMKYAIQFINVFGHDVRDLIYGPFRSLNQGFSGSGGGTPLGGGALFLSNTLFFGALVFMGPIAMLSFVGTALLAILVGFLIILVRNIAITLLIILAPIAIVCYILPNTEKVWKLWYTNFVGLLLVFPIIMALIAAGHVFSLIALTGSNANETTGAGSVTEVIGIVAFFIPYFILPLAFRFATGIIGNVAGFVNNKNSGAFDGLKNFRQKQREGNTAALKQGFNRTKIGTRLQDGRQKSLTSRAALASGALPGSARYRSEMSNAEFGHMAGSAAEAIKNNPSAAANDDSNKIAQSATSKRDFLTKYYDSKKRAGMSAAEQSALRSEAVNQLAFTEQAYGTNMGSTQMRHTAATAALASNSSTDEVGERAQWMRQAVKSHVMTSSQAASLIKQSGSLASSAGFGDLLGAAAVNPDDAAAVTASNESLLTAATKGFNPANSHRMRKGQAKEMAKEVHRQAQFAANQNGTASDEFAKVIADAAGMHDVMNGMTPDVREEFANYLNGASVGGIRIREHEALLEQNSHPAYMDRRKTWASSAVAGGGNTTPGGAVGGGGAGGGANNPPGGNVGSDKYLKRDIVPVSITLDGIQLYRFRYLWSDVEYVGVMAQDLIETHPEALSKDKLGYYQVNYGMLGLSMMTITEWEYHSVRPVVK